MDPLLLIPGPSPVAPRILEALAQPTVSHVSPILVDETRQALANLKRIVFTRDGQPFLLAGAGTLAMEIDLLNLARPGGRLLILSHGYFGDRMAEIAGAYGWEHDLLQSPWGSVVAPEDVARRLAEKPCDLVTATHVDTGSGGCAPVRDYAAAAKAAGALFVLDGVCATGGIEERMDDWGIDVVLTAAQKCLGAPPGLAIDVFSPAALARRRSLGAVRAYYADILRWLPVMDDPGRYFSTPCVNEHRALDEIGRALGADQPDERSAAVASRRGRGRGDDIPDVESLSQPHLERAVGSGQGGSLGWGAAGGGSQEGEALRRVIGPRAGGQPRQAAALGVEDGLEFGLDPDGRPAQALQGPRRRRAGGDGADEGGGAGGQDGRGVGRDVEEHREDHAKGVGGLVSFQEPADRRAVVVGDEDDLPARVRGRLQDSDRVEAGPPG